MKLQPIDIFIIGLYLVAMIVIGLVLKKKGVEKHGLLLPGRKNTTFLYVRLV